MRESQINKKRDTERKNKKIYEKIRKGKGRMEKDRRRKERVGWRERERHKRRKYFHPLVFGLHFYLKFNNAT